MSFFIAVLYFWGRNLLATMMTAASFPFKFCKRRLRSGILNLCLSPALNQ